MTVDLAADPKCWNESPTAVTIANGSTRVFQPYKKSGMGGDKFYRRVRAVGYPDLEPNCPGHDDHASTSAGLALLTAHGGVIFDP